MRSNPEESWVPSLNKDRFQEWAKERFRELFADRQLFLTRFKYGSRAELLASIQAIRNERKMLISHGEMAQIASAVKATARIPGDMAEFGVAYGGSAKLIAKYGGGRTLHLFDTFEGLPAPGPRDSERFYQGSYRCSLESVSDYLKSYPAKYYKGFFPDSAIEASECRFSFVHLDVDLYQSTLDGLKFFYPRMSPGAILVSHDYPSAEGVLRAFTEFFADKQEPVVELTGYQCMFVKL